MRKVISFFLAAILIETSSIDALIIESITRCHGSIVFGWRQRSSSLWSLLRQNPHDDDDNKSIVQSPLVTAPASGINAPISSSSITSASTHRRHLDDSHDNPNDGGFPRPDPSLCAIDVVTLCMNMFLKDDGDDREVSATAPFTTTTTNAARLGLKVCFDFSTDRCRAATGGSLDEFTRYAENPTFAYLIQCQAWRIVAVGPIIAGTSHRGSMQTVLMDVAREMTPLSDDDDDDTNGGPIHSRRFLWTLQQERRPPKQGCWMIHEVLYTKNAWQQTL